jgi:mycothiol synthase
MDCRFRAPTPDDIPAIVEVVRACELADYGDAEFTAEDLHVVWRLIDREQDAWVGERDGEIVSTGVVRLRSPTRIRSFGYVLPAQTGQGIGSELLRRIEERARELAARAPAGEEVYLSQDVTPRVESQVALFERHDFRLIRRFWKMGIELADEPAEPAWPEGIRVASMQRGEERAVFDASEEAFADHWDHQPHDYDEWRSFMIERESFDPSLWPLAWDADEIAGFSLCGISPDEGWVGVIGVRPPWRKRGLGLALLLESFRRLRDKGAARCALYVDSENPTGATRLYERAGMHVVRESEAWTKVIRPASSAP